VGSNNLCYPIQRIQGHICGGLIRSSIWRATALNRWCGSCCKRRASWVRPRSTIMVEVMAHLLGAEALHFEYPTQQVLDSVTMGVSAGDRIGIVGRNGDGKSTLMKLLVGRLEPDAGQVTIRSDTTIGMLDQSDAVDTSLTVGQSVVGDLAEYEWASDPKIRDVIRGLVSDLNWDALVGSLSGGQRRRVALAKLLIGDWDILALDEPTNHLDVEGIAWL